jgi:hypothetical protein
LPVYTREATAYIHVWSVIEVVVQVGVHGRVGLKITTETCIFQFRKSECRFIRGKVVVVVQVSVSMVGLILKSPDWYERPYSASVHSREARAYIHARLTSTTLESTNKSHEQERVRE